MKFFICAFIETTIFFEIKNKDSKHFQIGQKNFFFGGEFFRYQRTSRYIPVSAVYSKRKEFRSFFSKAHFRILKRKRGH